MSKPRDPSKVGDVRVCVGCGVEFVAKRYDQRSCGQRSCARAAMKEGKFKTEELPVVQQVLSPRLCPECGKEFQPIRSSHVYCTKPCSTKASNRKSRENMTPAMRKKYSDRYRVKNVEGINERNRRYMQSKRFKAFGATPDDFDRLVQEQQGRCANPACRAEPPLLSFDHCHDTMKPRGLLCEPCNKAAGFGKDSASVLRGLADYLDHYAEKNEKIADSHL